MKMKKRKSKAKIPAHLAARLNELESRAAEIGLEVHYDLMEAAGLKLNGGLCKIQGKPHLFIDRRASAAERIAAIESSLKQLSLGILQGTVDQNVRLNSNEPDK
ncbi:MAG: hypothetical protein R6U13_15630 [Desulfatiglandaceae bacterium]